MSSFIKAGVIGHPIAHSKSPIIHSHWIEKYGLKGSYEKIDIPPNNFKKDISTLIDQGYVGFNVTVPHKQTIMALCDYIDETATAIGAVNTVKIIDNKLYGYNTDAYGFIQNIKQSVPEFNFTSGAALVLGAGGAARAIVYGLLKQGVPEIIVTNRTIEKSFDIMSLDNKRIRVVEWDLKEANLKNVHLVVNTTSLGMKGQSPLIFNLSDLPKQAIVNDIVYAPLKTNLLTNAELSGNLTLTGIGMLLHQARQAFEKWFGIMPEVDDALIEKVLA